MKLWNGFGTEHSMNLVMIGQFKDVTFARAAKRILDRLKEGAKAEEKAGRLVIGDPLVEFSDELFKILSEAEIYSLTYADFEQFLYDDTKVSLSGDQIVIETDEVEVIAFVKVLLDKGAKLEMYSGHDFKDTGYGRVT
ncbi:DUF6375 family protein [Nocardioides bruguierae]|uniref:DUF6375 family protein n=1 Tax=Nocardioides bruguierae TaxID=2945102 RepID=UPI00202143CA|nr:DUF6375 family protein [Nocardioides bruguierae]MCL8023779.1 DUF6375 family protein [Nocardioides bruguierae]